MNPRYPVYIPTKGRYNTPYTIRALERMRVPYKAVVEEQEVDDYISIAKVKPENILVLPHRDKGLVVTRNWIWDYAQASGVERFWTLDDNIEGFYRLNHNLKIRLASGTAFYAMEEFVERYENIVIAGMNYWMFAKRKDKLPPYVANTRVYSNMLIQTNARDLNGNLFRNEGFYNDDTDLCLRVLKNGYCIIQFNAFLITKFPTMTLKGGMTPYYQQNLDGKEGKENDGRYRMAKELMDKHPDVTRITWKFNHWQHQVDYSRFRDNKLIRKPGVVIPEGVNNFGMVLKVNHGARNGS